MVSGLISEAYHQFCSQVYIKIVESTSCPAPTKMSEAHTSESTHFEFFENSLESVATLYRDTKSADVHFTFESSNNGEEIRIDAHRSLLAATSDVFDAMFYGGLKESADIRVVDASDAAFKEFLQYFYQRRVKLTAENVAEVSIIMII